MCERNYGNFEFSEIMKNLEIAILPENRELIQT